MEIIYDFLYKALYWGVTRSNDNTPFEGKQHSKVQCSNLDQSLLYYQHKDRS